MIKIPKTRYSRGVLGFSLLELLVVLAIMGLLMSLVGPQVLNQLGGAKSKTAMIQIKDFEQALEMYSLDVGNYPSTTDGLEALIRKPSGADGWNGPYLKGDIPKDPWKKEYLYKYPGEHANLILPATEKMERLVEIKKILILRIGIRFFRSFTRDDRRG